MRGGGAGAVRGAAGGDCGSLCVRPDPAWCCGVWGWRVSVGLGVSCAVVGVCVRSVRYRVLKGCKVRAKGFCMVPHVQGLGLESWVVFVCARAVCFSCVHLQAVSLCVGRVPGMFVGVDGCGWGLL